MKIQDLIKQRILILDGALGTMIQEYGLEEKDFRNQSLADYTGQIKGNNDILNLTRPDIIMDIHKTHFHLKLFHKPITIWNIWHAKWH